jgi:hypothetical protein
LPRLRTETVSQIPSISNSIAPRHIDYIHFNPVKHGYVSRVLDWPRSSFHRFVAKGILLPDWGGDVGEVTGGFGEQPGGATRGHGASRLAHPTAQAA